MLVKDSTIAPEFFGGAPRKKRHTGRNVFLVFFAVVLIGALAAGGYVYNLAHSFNNGTHTLEHVFPDDAKRPAKSADGKAVNILLMGSDTRGNLGDLQNEGPTGERSDTMMLMHIPADHKNVYVMSVMRDLWVDIPGQGNAKINAALSYGGIPLVVETLEGLFDSRIDHVAVIDFEGFKSLTDALGGVDVNVPFDFTSSGSKGEHFAKGVQTLNGESALKFVRERHAFTDGDYQRVRDQQAFVKGIMAKFLKKSTLTNPGKISDVVGKFSPYLSVDSGLDAGTVARLGLDLRNVRTNDVHMFTLPTKGTGTSPDGQSIVLPDQGAIDAISGALKDDTLGDYLNAAGPDEQ